MRNTARVLEQAMTTSGINLNEKDIVEALKDMAVTVKRGQRLRLIKTDDKYEGTEYIVCQSEGSFHLINIEKGTHRGACKEDGIDKKSIPLHKIIGPSTNARDWVIL